MVILHDAVKKVQNLGFLFFFRKKRQEEKENPSFYQPMLGVTQYIDTCGSSIGR